MANLPCTEPASTVMLPGYIIINTKHEVLHRHKKQYKVFIHICFLTYIQRNDSYTLFYFLRISTGMSFPAQTAKQITEDSYMYVVVFPTEKQVHAPYQNDLQTFYFLNRLCRTNTIISLLD